MQIRSITVNAAGLAAGTDMQGNSPMVNQVSHAASQIQAGGRNSFGPGCRVSISQEGKDLSRQQAAEKSAQGTASVKEERMLLRKQEEAQRSKEIREGYREKLNEIDKTISDLNASYPLPKKRKAEDVKDPYDAKMMDEAMKNRLDLREAMQDQKDFQAQESQRLAKEAQQLAMQSAKYKQEVDDNNRDLLTLLKTVEEAEKAEEERENGGGQEGISSISTSASGTQDPVGGMLEASAAQFMASAVNQEWNVEQLLAGFKGDGNWFLDTADSITRNILQKTDGIRAALDDEAVTDEQLAEMMESLQDGLADNYENVENYRGWGLQVLRLAREDKIQHLADDPLKGMQDTKKSVHQAVVDAALGEARQSGLDKASQEIADEVKKLIDERNDVDRAPQEKEEDEKEQAKKEEEEEQNQMQEEPLRPEKQDRGSI